MISKRMLTKWRKDALRTRKAILDFQDGTIGDITYSTELVEELVDRVLYLTRELIDQCLMKE